jgi:hypothetical protein
MKNVVLKILLATAVIALPLTALSSTQADSFQGPWSPPTILRSNTWYSQTVTFSGVSTGTITQINWQLFWLVWNNSTGYSDGVPPGSEIEICDAESHCTLPTTFTTNGNTTYFTGESINQTFTFWFKIPTAKTVTYSSPGYMGVSTNSWLTGYYQY